MMRYDLIIVGGGLVGAGLAVALRHSNLQIALIDARLPSNTDPRLFALNDNSCQFLKNIGVWPQLSAEAAPIHQVHVSSQGRFGAVRLNASDVKLASLGHVIPAYIIEKALNDALASLPNVTLFRPAQLKTLVQQDGRATLTILKADTETTLESSIVIGADGTESAVRTQMNIPIETVDYEQSAIVTRTTLQRAHQHIAYERFTQDGAIAMLPLVGDECATIWSASKEKTAKLLSLSDPEFLQALQKEFGYRLGRLQKIARRHNYPLRMVRAKKNVEGCVLLLGNSAHTLHPIASQGLNLALYETAVLIDELSAHPTDLNKINGRIKAQQTMSINVSHQLSSLFSSKSALVNCMLQLGMVGFDIGLSAKKHFITKIMGMSGRVPQLLLSAME
jgi:2-octaprenyl-6-methoxyphenol hydroxylase